jgi:hypothetical protein
MGLLDGIFGKEEINQLKKQLVEKSDFISKIESQLAELIGVGISLEGELAKFQKIILEKNSSIQTLNENLSEYKNQRDALSFELEKNNQLLIAFKLQSELEINEANLKYPIIVYNNNIVDGVHRLTKASLLNKKTSVSIVFSEHTFYFEVKDIICMFSQFGFSCKRLNYFKEHSLFFLFQKDESTSLLPSFINTSTKEKFSDHFYGKEKRIQEINIQTPFYIMPSHYIGQMVYHFSDKKEKILGFLDNDKNKTGKRLYGTECQTYLPTAERLANATVLLVSNPYKKEMKEQLLSLSPSVNIVECEI